MFVVFEGIDGSGKDTQVRHYGEWLERMGKPVCYEVEPTRDSDAGRKIHELLERKESKEQKNDDAEVTIDKLNTEEVLSLYLADRFAHTEKIRKHLANAKVVISTRYDLSSYAYQTIHTATNDLKSVFEHIYDLHGYGSKTLIPNYTIYFSLSVNAAWERIEERFKQNGVRHGFEKIAVLKQVEERYLAAIKYLQSRDQRYIAVVDATRTREEIVKEVIHIVTAIS